MLTIPDHAPVTWFFIAVVTVVSSARVARLVGFDVWPPSKWLRRQWDKATGASDWNDLVRCPFCIAPWFTLAVLGWGYFTDWNLAWWLFNGWMAASYAASYILIYDGSND